MAVAVSVAVDVPDGPEPTDSSATEVTRLFSVGDADTWTVGEGEAVRSRGFPFTGLSHRPGSLGVAAVSVGVGSAVFDPVPESVT